MIINKLKGNKSFYFYSFILISIVIAEIGLTCYIPEWRKGFYSMLQEKHEHLFMYQMMLLIALYTSLSFAQGMKVWVGQKTSFIIRVALSKITLKKLVYQRDSAEAPAFSQAMTGAIQNSTELFLRVAVEIAISFAIVMVLIYNNLHNPLILYAAVAYSAGVSLIAYFFQKPLTVADRSWQEAESVYREAIVTISNNKGDHTSKDKFLQLIVAYYKYIKTQMYFQLMSRMKGMVGTVIPYFILGTSYFSGQIDFGGFMAGIATFELLVINMTIFISMYPEYIKAKASQQLVSAFLNK